MRLIDADALKQKCFGRRGGLMHTSDIDNAPTIETESVKHGEWIEQEVITGDKAGIEEWQSAKCSKCGKYHTTPYMYYFSHYDYCPSCGCKMDEEEE